MARVLSEQFFEKDGAHLRYLIGGTGKPLILCHGFLSSAEEFGGRFEALTRQRTLIVPDLPGNAHSRPLNGRHTAGNLAAAVDALLAHLDVDAFDLGGLCLGASVACALMDRHAHAVDRLILHTPLIAPSLVRSRYRAQVRTLMWPGLWQAVIAASRNRTASDLYKKFVIREGNVDARTSEINFENQRRASPHAAREWLVDALQRDDISLLEQRSRPTLVIVAANDGLVNVPRLRDLVTGLPHVQLFIDDDAGHGWSEAAVRRHLTVLESFLA